MVSAQMPLRTAKTEVRARLAAAGCENAAMDADALLEKALGAPVWQCRADAVLSEAQARLLEEMTCRRERREPLQYILGRWGFYALELAVGEGVLCPRADTETIVEAVLARAPGIAEEKKAAGRPAPLRLLDLCAGTGAIGLALLSRLPDAQLVLVEKSEAAFRYLTENVRRIAGETRLAEGGVQPQQGDLFTVWHTLPAGGFDIITCNPPYLTAQEMRELQPEVAREPTLALDGGTDGLDFYRALAEHYQRCLAPGGLLALEIGWRQRKAVCGLLADAGWADIAAVPDLAGNDRCVLAYRRA